MGPGHPHHPHGPHADGFPYGPHPDGFPYGPHPDGFGAWWLGPALLVALIGLLLLLWLAGDDRIAGLLGGAGGGLRAGWRARWRAAVARHREVAAAFAGYECDPQAVLRRPALADVREPATARFVDAFAEACARATERYPGRAAGDAFVDAVDRSARAWAAAKDVAERLHAVHFAPGERDLLRQAAALLTLARQSPHEGERLAAYAHAAHRLAELERLCGFVLPQHAAAVLQRDARTALAGSSA